MSGEDDLKIGLKMRRGMDIPNSSAPKDWVFEGRGSSVNGIGNQGTFIENDYQLIFLTLFTLPLFFNEVEADRRNKGQGTPENKGQARMETGETVAERRP
jgi:hypothetical protein